MKPLTVSVCLDTVPQAIMLEAFVGFEIDDSEHWQNVRQISRRGQVDLLLLT